MALPLYSDWHGVEISEVLNTIRDCEWIRTSSARVASRIRREASAHGVSLTVLKSSGTFVIVRDSKNSRRKK